MIRRIGQIGLIINNNHFSNFTRQKKYVKEGIFLNTHEQVMAPFRECANIPEVLQYWLSRQPDKTLYRWLNDTGEEETLLTFAELDAKARTVAVALLNHCRPGDRALLLYAPGLDYVAAFLGCLYAGVIAVPTYPPDPARLENSLPRLLSIVEDCTPSLLLSTEMLLQFGEVLWGGQDSIKSIRQIATDTLENVASGFEIPADIKGDAIAFLQYTSGSTGGPKGVMITHANLMANSYGCHSVAGHTIDDVYVSWLPAYHDMGLIGGILQPLSGGYTGILMSPITFLKKPFRWLEAISRYRGVTSPFPNFALDLCVRKVTETERATLDLSSWRIACNGAEPVRRESLERFAETFAPCGFNKSAFLPGYGLAEATLGVSGLRDETPALTFLELDSNSLLCGEIVVTEKADGSSQTFVGCGKLLPDVQVRIVHPEERVPVAKGQLGEIWVQSPSVGHGYWNKPEISEEVFCARLATGEGPWLRTGDLGFFHVGELFITGRIKDLIIVQGKNHYPQDLEKTVESVCPELRAGCLAAFSIDVENTERVVLVAELDARSGDVDLEIVIKTARQAVAQHHGVALHDVAIIRANTIPKTSSGKIQRQASKIRYLAQELDLLETAGAAR